mgnify:CR=1 FL=1
MAIELRRGGVYCGAGPGRDPAAAAAASALGTAVGGRGLMGLVTDGVLAGGGHVTGVIPGFLDQREIAHTGVTDLRVVDTMHERKALMAELSDAFIAMPGGVGTFEELFEAITWTQLGVHDKPVALLDVVDFWAPVRALLDHAVTERFVRPELRASIVEGNDPHGVLDALSVWEKPAGEKWIDVDGRPRTIL